MGEAGILEPGQVVTTSKQKRKNLKHASPPWQDRVVMRLYSGDSSTKQQRFIHLKSGNLLLDFLDSEDLQDERVVSVM